MMTIQGLFANKKSMQQALLFLIYNVSVQDCALPSISGRAEEGHQSLCPSDHHLSNFKNGSAKTS